MSIETAYAVVFLTLFAILGILLHHAFALRKFRISMEQKEARRKLQAEHDADRRDLSNTDGRPPGTTGEGSDSGRSIREHH